jgi:hypothetical protein
VAFGLGTTWRFANLAGEGMVLLVDLFIVPVVAELAVRKRGAAEVVTAFEGLAPCLVS